MNVARRLFLATALLATALQGNAKSLQSECLRKEIEAHVLQQFGAYGPLSVNREYFGFIYLHDGAIGSAVTRSRVCAKAGNCRVDSSEAIRSIPQSAKVLGEWHTHPHHGSGSLSADDVRGAYNNRHISCYSAFYSTPSGAIYAWNANQISVPVAMASRAHIGNYMDSALALAGRNPALDRTTSGAIWIASARPLISEEAGPRCLVNAWAAASTARR